MQNTTVNLTPDAITDCALTEIMTSMMIKTSSIPPLNL